MTKKEQMKVVTDALQTVIRINKENEDVEVRYYMMTADIIDNLGKTIVERFRLVEKDEYVFFMKDAHILYVQNVSGDSALTALAEATFLAAGKF